MCKIQLKETLSGQIGSRQVFPNQYNSETNYINALKCVLWNTVNTSYKNIYHKNNQRLFKSMYWDRKEWVLTQRI